MAGVREMITLLGSLLGFGSSFLPEVLNYFKANQAQKHRMEMMHLETELAQKLGVSRKCLWERRQRLGLPRKKTNKTQAQTSN